MYHHLSRTINNEYIGFITFISLIIPRLLAPEIIITFIIYFIQNWLGLLLSFSVRLNLMPEIFCLAVSSRLKLNLLVLRSATRAPHDDVLFLRLRNVLRLQQVELDGGVDDE